MNVRVMDGEVEVLRDGKLGLTRMGLAKKLEGLPDHPINHGKLCTRGQAAAEILCVVVRRTDQGAALQIAGADDAFRARYDAWLGRVKT